MFKNVDLSCTLPIFIPGLMLLLIPGWRKSGKKSFKSTHYPQERKSSVQTLGQLNTILNFAFATGFHNNIAILDCAKYVLFMFFFYWYSVPILTLLKAHKIQITSTVRKIFECNDLHISLTLFINSGNEYYAFVFVLITLASLNFKQKLFWILLMLMRLLGKLRNKRIVYWLPFMNKVYNIMATQSITSWGQLSCGLISKSVSLHIITWAIFQSCVTLHIQ